MQSARSIVFLGLLVLNGTSALTIKSTDDKTITKVVKMLQTMLDTSKEKGDEERKAYAKFICGCKDRETEYKNTIKTMTEQITILANEIAGLKADNAKLSAEAAELKFNMAENKKAQEQATNLRNKENDEFIAEKEDLESAIGQLKEALETLAAVNADQTEATGEDHIKFMAGYNNGTNLGKYTPLYDATSPVSFLKAKASLQRALVAASAFMDEQKSKKVASFMQAPFTGTYTSQSVEVMGILKNMKDTFDGNLAKAIAAEAAAQAAYDKLMTVLKGEYKVMDESYKKAQLELSSNDDALKDKSITKKANEDTLAEAEGLLEKNTEMCDAKKAEYSKRRLLQVEEEAAISEAISILNSDAAFATFGTVDATSTGTLKFIQLRSIRRHSTANEALRSQLMHTLQKVRGSKRLSKLASLVRAVNVFGPVLEEIDKMIKIIAEEGKEDKKNLDFCNDERTKNDALIAEKNRSIEEELKPAINKLFDKINDPDTGLKAEIAENEDLLAQNKETQKTKTAERNATNALFKEDIKNLDEAESILTKAIDVLTAYYDKLDAALGAALLQKKGTSHMKKNTPLPETDTAVLNMKGESKSGNEVISMLKHILSETETEETDAIAAEKKSVEDYEDAMSSLKIEMTNLENTLANLAEALATAEKDLEQTTEEMKATEADMIAAQDYLASIKPGCDFITTNFDYRESSRATETKTLEQAIKLIKGTPTYMNYEAETHTESLGKCASLCEPEPKDKSAICKACLVDVTVPAYCAGHPGTPGCTSFI